MKKSGNSVMGWPASGKQPGVMGWPTNSPQSGSGGGGGTGGYSGGMVGSVGGGGGGMGNRFPRSQYQTSIDATRQVYDPTRSLERLRANPGFQFASPAANSHANDLYRYMGQSNAVGLGRDATKAQMGYALPALQAQNQSVLGGLANLTQQTANRGQESSAYDSMRYRWLNNTIGQAFGALGGLR